MLKLAVLLLISVPALASTPDVEVDVLPAEDFDRAREEERAGKCENDQIINSERFVVCKNEQGEETRFLYSQDGSVSSTRTRSGRRSIFIYTKHREALSRQKLFTLGFATSAYSSTSTGTTPVMGLEFGYRPHLYQHLFVGSTLERPGENTGGLKSTNAVTLLHDAFVFKTSETSSITHAIAAGLYIGNLAREAASGEAEASTRERGFAVQYRTVPKKSPFTVSVYYRQEATRSGSKTVGATVSYGFLHLDP